MPSGGARKNPPMVSEFLTWQRESRGRTSSTVYNYGSVLAAWLDWLGDTPLGHADVGDMEAWVKRPRDGRAMGNMAAPATRAKYVAILRSLYKYLHARGYVTENPALLLHTPTVHNRQPKAIADPVWMSLWPSDMLDVYERVALGLGFFVGLRRREICELRVGHVRLDEMVLWKFPRKGGGDDITPMGDILAVFESRLPNLGHELFLEPLEKLVSERSSTSGGDNAQLGAYLLPWGEFVPAPARERRIHALDTGMTDPQHLNRVVQRCIQRTGCTTRFTPHSLRHSFVTNLLRAGVPLHLVQRMANHTSPAVTMRYVKASGAELREWLRSNVNRMD